MRRAAVALGRRLFHLVTRHPLRRQRLAVEAAVTLVGLKATIATLPYERWQRLVVVTGSGGAGPLSGSEIADVVWAVDRVGGSLPGVFTCLPRALTGRAMLRRRGGDPALCIGVMRGPDGQVAAHAWLEIDRQVVLGAVPELERFQRLRRWPRGATVTSAAPGRAR